MAPPMTTDTSTAPEPVQTLAEYKAERLAPPKPAEAAKPPGEVVGEATEVVEGADKDDKGEADPPKDKKAKLQGRFSELTEQRREAEARAEREALRAATAERERDELKAKLEPKKVEPDEAPKPKPEEYADAFQYAADLAEWTARKAVVEDRKEREAAAEKEKADSEAVKVQTAWKSRVAEAKKQTPDWEDVITASELQVSNPVRDTLIESEHGPSILYLLASEPERVEKLKGMTILGQLREIGKLEARFEKAPADTPANTAAAPAPAPRARPPEPITPVRGNKTADNPTTSDGEFKGSYQDWKAARQRAAH